MTYRASSQQINQLLDGISSVQGSVLYRDVSDWRALPTGTSGFFLQTTGAASNPQWAAAGGVSSVGSGAGLTGGPITGSGTLAVDAAYERNQLAGLILSNDGVAPNTKIDISAGVCVDDTNAAFIKNAAGAVDCTTTGANALDAGSLANSTWYHIFSISKADGTAAFLASTSVSAPTFPTGYTLKRRIGSARTDGSAHFITFVQIEDTILWNVPVHDVNAVGFTNASATATTFTVPTGVRVRPIVRFASATTSLNVWSADVAPGTPGAMSSVPGFLNATGSSAAAAFSHLYTNTSAQLNIEANAAGPSTATHFWTDGWIDTRGRVSA